MIYNIVFRSAAFHSVVLKILINYQFTMRTKKEILLQYSESNDKLGNGWGGGGDDDI
jgi:hypothetical protein